MSVKSKILPELEQNRDLFLSGQFLADKFGVSRNSVWKAINEIKKDGYIIESSTNKGYKISECCDKTSAKAISTLCRNNILVYYSESVDSTNNEAKRIIGNKSDADKVLIVSDEQTLGRGRNGKGFFSPKENGIYFSLILSPKSDVISSVGLTCYAAVCVVKAIKELTDIDTKIKWVNDIYLNDKKICGILTEAISDFESGKVSNIIIGIGINLKQCELPDDIKGKAGFLNFDKPIKNQLVANIADRLIDFDNNKDSFIDYYRKHSAVLGKEIKYYKNGSEYFGTAIDIDSDGGLIVSKNGITNALRSGEISIIIK